MQAAPAHSRKCVVQDSSVQRQAAGVSRREGPHLWLLLVIPVLLLIAPLIFKVLFLVVLALAAGHGWRWGAGCWVGKAQKKEG